MKKILVAATLGLSLLSLVTGCHVGVRGSGVRKTEKRELAAFTAIDTTGAVEIEVSCQKPASFEIEGDDNILPLIETNVRNGVLHISSAKPYRSGRILMRITIPDLESIKSTGAGKFTVSDLKNDRFEIDSTGATTVIASGVAKSVKIGSTGAGKIDTHNLRAADAEVNVSGAAGVEVYATDKLDVTVSGAARVTYSGSPRVSKRVSGAGQVTKKGGNDGV